MKFKNIAEVAASIVIVCGIPFFFLQNYIDGQNKKVNNVIVYHRQLYSEHFSRVRRDLIKPWMQYKLASIIASDPPTEVINKLVRDVVETNESMVFGLYEMNEFYEGLQSCIKNKLCDNQITEQLFKADARGLYCLYKPAIEDIKNDLLIVNFGDAIKDIAKIKSGIC